MLNNHVKYVDGVLHVGSIPVSTLAQNHGTPTYVYSLDRIRENYQRIISAFANLNIHAHYSIKANGNLTILKTLLDLGAGFDAVSAGEIYRALQAGAKPDQIVFAGVGKRQDEISYALEQGIGWFNVENALELDHINAAASRYGVDSVKVALRLNPQVTANTHPYIATGHGGAKFGLTAETIMDILNRQMDFPVITFAGLHVHIGSQLHDVEATVEAVGKAVDLVKPFPQIRTINIGGGLPVAYTSETHLPGYTEFSAALEPILRDYDVLLEPGRSIVADAGILVTELLYVKRQAGQIFYIVDASMSELIRPALYQAHHEIVPVQQGHSTLNAHIVGPVCETTDVLGRDVPLPELEPGALLAILTTGAYGNVMASNYNARPRPAEVVVDGQECFVARRRETWQELIEAESL